MKREPASVAGRHWPKE